MPIQNLETKILIVVQRFGLDVSGGSESLAREWAHRLSKNYQITVATTCAKDDTSWKNYYPEGDNQEGNTWNSNVLVKRFKVDFPRDIDAFSFYSSSILSHPRVQLDSVQEEWMQKQGPVSTTLFEFLEQHSRDYQLVIFFTYLYATTALGMRKVPSEVPTVLVSTAHDEPPIYLPIFKDVFYRPDFILFNTEAEKRFCYKLFPKIKRSCIIGGGIDVAHDFLNRNKDAQLGDTPYFLYVGRIAPGKWLPELFEYYKQLFPSIQVPLHLVGRVQMECPQDSYFKYLGFVSKEERDHQIKYARAMIVPSHFESLSLSTLESWSLGTPVIVNGQCEVLADHVYQSCGGLIYRYGSEFRLCIEYAISHPKEMAVMGQQGYNYVRDNYSWSVIEQRLQENLSSILTLRA